MKKVMFAVIAVMLCLTVMAQDKPKFTVPNPEIYVGIAETIHNTAGDTMKFSGNFSTNFNAGVRVYVLPKLSLKAEYTRDTLALGDWKATGTFGYYSYNLAVEYWVLKNAYIFAQPIYFTDLKTGLNKWGGEVGVGLKTDLTKHIFWSGSFSYLRVKDFLLPTNTAKLQVNLGYSF